MMGLDLKDAYFPIPSILPTAGIFALLAIHLALKAFFQVIRGKVVLAKTDMTTKFYLQKQGSTYSPQLSALAQAI